MRLFFAIKINPFTQEAIQQVIKPLYQQYNNTEINWVKPQNYHLTLRFLGEIKLDILSLLINTIHSTVKGKTALTLSINKPIIFPGNNKPKVLALDVIADTQLIQLADSINQTVINLGLRPDAHSFKPHITIGYIKNKHLSAPHLDKTIHIKMPSNKLTLYESDKKNNHGLYIPIATI